MGPGHRISPWRAGTMTGTPVVFIHGLWLHATSWESWAELFSAAGYDPIAPGWPGDARHGGSLPGEPGQHRRPGHRRCHPSLPGHHRHAAVPADPDRPLVRRHDRREAARPGLRGGRHRHRRRADQGRAPAAPVGAALDPAGVQESRQQAQGGLPDRRAVPLQLRQRGQRRSPTRCTSDGRSRHRASPCSRRPRPTSRCTPRPRSTRTTRDAARCCSSWAAGTTPCPRRSPRPP